MDTTTWICPNKPFAHDWNGGLSCGCGATRTAADAITSLLAGWEGWDQSRAAALVEQHRTEVLRDNTPEPMPDDFFQPGHTYKHEAWTFRCDTITTHPETGERTVLGWFRFRNDTWRSLSCGEAEWAEGVWTDIT